MTPLYTEEEFNAAKSSDRLLLKCEHCGDSFLQLKMRISSSLRGNHGTKCNYCSFECSCLCRRKDCITSTCAHCGKEVIKKPHLVKGSKNYFCNHSCAATYNNTHKIKGYRRSKLEEWIENKLPELYPSLEFHFNRKDAIDSELDIYLPQLKVAFELNGIFHYEPIYSQEKLEAVQNNDRRKFQACGERGISLCVIDTSKQKYFKEKECYKYLDIITSIINEAMEASL